MSLLVTWNKKERWHLWCNLQHTLFQSVVSKDMEGTFLHAMSQQPSPFHNEEFLQLFHEELGASPVKVQSRVCGATLQDEDEIGPPEVRTWPLKALQVSQVEVYDILGLRGARWRVSFTLDGDGACSEGWHTKKVACKSHLVQYISCYKLK